jgi:hypothetical protein
MEPSPVSVVYGGAQLSADQRFVLLRLDEDHGASTTLALPRTDLARLLADLTRLHSAMMEDLELQDAGPEGPGG